MRVILHIGQGKAGSTSIQLAFHENRDRFLGAGVLYPKTKYIRESHHFLSPLHFEHPERWPSVVARMGLSVEGARARAKEEWESCREQIVAAAAPTVLFSSECIFSAYNLQEAERARSTIRSLNAELRILAYLRSPVGRYLSFIQQKLHGARKIIPPAASAVVDVLRTNEVTFGCRVEVRAFSRSELKNSDAVDDFIEWAGIPDIGIQSSAPNQNASLSSEAMAVLAELGPDVAPADRDSVRRQRALVAAVSKEDVILEGATKPKLNPKIAEYLNRVNSELNILRDEYGIVFDDIDYSIVGKREGLTRPAADAVEDLCLVDQDRFFVLRERVQREILGGDGGAPTEKRSSGWTRLIRAFK